MTRWKGRTASSAPSLGRFVSALGAAASPLTLAAAMLSAPVVFAPVSTGSEAWAANECGIYTAPNGTITCNLTTYTTGPNDDIIYTGVDGITLNLDDAAMDVTVATTAVNVAGDGASSNPITINGTSFGTISTTNAHAYGVLTQTATATTVTTTLTSGAITTSGDRAFGIYKYGAAASTGGLAAAMEGGSISTSGTAAIGMYLDHDGLGPVDVTMSGGSIETTGGDWPHITPIGIRADIRNTSSTSALTVRMTGGSITAAHHGMSLTNNGHGPTNVFMTSGTITNTGPIDNGAGFSLFTGGTATQSVTMSGGSISTAAVNGQGIKITVFGPADAHATMSDDGAIETTGGHADGIQIWNPFFGNLATVDMSGGTITTSGVDSNGISVVTTGFGATYRVSATGGLVTSGTGLAAGIHTAGSGGGTIDISPGATIDGSASRIGIRDGDFNLFGGTISDGVDETGGDVVVTTTGTVTGDAILGLGNDTFNLTGGTYTGDIYGDDVVAAAGDGDDIFNWSGGTWGSDFFGMNGSDAANITAPTYDGTHHVLDGGDDVFVADGWIDVLTLNGITADANGANIINWEVVTLDGAELTVVDGAWAVGEADPTTGVFLTNSSMLNGGPSLALTGNMSVDATSTFQGLGGGAGTYAISGSLINAGVVTTQDGAPGDTVTVGSDYSGTGQFLTDVDFTGDTGDTLVIGGDVTGGVTTVVVNDVSTGTASRNDVLVVDVAGTSPASMFQLQGGTVSVGGFLYQLEQVGSDWFLTSICVGNQTVNSAVPAVLSCVTPDTVTATTGADVAGNIEGAGGTDTITVDGDADVAGTVHGGEDGGDGSAAADTGDTIVINTTGTVGGVDGDLGNDTITLTAGTITGDVIGDSGNDTIQLNGGSVGDDVLGNGGADEITLNGATITDDIRGNGGADIITLSSGSVGDEVRGNGGADQITLNGASIGDDIRGNGGADTITLSGGSVGDDVFGNGGGDTITLSGATVTDAINAGTGDDTFTWSSGTMASFTGGNGTDTATVTAATYDGTQLLDGGDDTSSADGWIDELTLDGVTVTVNGANITNWEVVSFDNSTVTINGLTTESVRICGGSTTLGGSTAADEVLGCVTDDTITVTNNTAVSDVIEGAGAADTISVTGNASVAGGVFGGRDGQDSSAASDGNDQITIDTTGNVLLVDGGPGNDMINLNAGTITTNVLGQEGVDVITLAGATVTNAVDGGAGTDVILLNSGTAESVDGGADGDRVTLAGAAITNAIDGGTGDDVLAWSSGTLGSFTGSDGSDAATVTASEFDGSQVLDGGDDVTTADGFIDTVTLQNISVSVPGANLPNWENVIVDGGTISFSDDALESGSDAGTGLTITNGGTADGGATFALTGNMTVAAASTFQGFGAGAGVYTISSNLANAGIVTTRDSAVGDTVTVAGDYSGTGLLLVDTDLSTDSSDVLVIGGGVTAGATIIVVNDVTVGTATGNDVLVVDVSGTTAAGDFALAGGTVVNGAYQYALTLINSQWFLSPTVLPQIPTYEAYPQHLLGQTTLPTMRQRIGNRYWRDPAAACADGIGERDDAFDLNNARENADGCDVEIEDNAIWARIEAAHANIEPAASTTSATYEEDTWSLHAGIDGLVHENAAGDRFFVGLTGRYGTATMDVSSPFGNGAIDSSGTGLGLTATWFATSGFYVDAQGAVTWFDSDLSTPSGSVTGNDGVGYALSLEVGRQVDFEGRFVVTPQAQLIYALVDFETFTGPNSEVASIGNAESLRGRLGISLDHNRIWSDDLGRKQRVQLYAIANLHYEFLDGTTVNVSGTELKSELEAWTGEIGLGLTRNWNDDRFSLYGEVNAATGLESFGDSYRFSGTAGGRVRW